MPTIEERLAALETKLAALTDTTPTTYYEHQYSGEEIDNAVSRALPNGAIDQAVGTFVRPNLLDNWYFGRPVDQRGGYIVPKGVNYYKVDGFVPQGPIPETVKVDYIDQSGSAIFNYGGVPCYVPKDGGYVRGYIPAWNQCTIDRWSTEGDVGEIKVVVSTGCVDVTNMLLQSVDHSIQFKQMLPAEICLSGKTYTLSILTKDVVGHVTAYVGQSGAPYHPSFEFPITSGLSTYTGIMIDGQQKMGLTFSTGASASIIAIKLELGSTQTLAHQENGQWVLNEIPDYGEQLRRCQMDLFKIGDAVRYCSLGNGVARDGQYVSITIPTPVTMRTMPVLIAPPVGFTMRHNDTLVSGGANFSVDAFSQNSIMLKVQSQVALTPGDMWEAFLSPNGSLVFSAEL